MLFELSPFFLNKNKLESHKTVCENKDFWITDQYQKPGKVPFVIYSDLQSLIKQILIKKFNKKRFFNPVKRALKIINFKKEKNELWIY